MADDASPVTTRPGPIIRAFEEGRPITLDEYNKGKPGTDSNLQVLWQFFIGEIDQHTVVGGAGQTFTFRRADMQPGFAVTLTGNKASDGQNTHLLSRSAYQRLQPIEIPDPQVIDYQHRLCQILTGMPVSTLYYMNEEKWKNDSAGFTKFLLKMRMLGLDTAAQEAVPIHQLGLLANWGNLLKATEKLAGFYYNWVQTTDPASKLLEDSKMSEVAEEIDEEYFLMSGIGFRRMIRHCSDALKGEHEIHTKGDVVGFDLDMDWENGPDLDVEHDSAFIGTTLGGSLTNTVLQDVFNLTEGRPNSRKHVMDLAKAAGLISVGQLNEAAASGETIPQLLNITEDKNPYLMARTCQALLAAPYDAAMGTPDQLFPASSVLAQVVEAKRQMQSVMPNISYAVAVNPDLDARLAEPFQIVPIHTAGVQMMPIRRSAVLPFSAFVEGLLVAPGLGFDAGKLCMKADTFKDIPANDPTTQKPWAGISILTGKTDIGLASMNVIMDGSTDTDEIAAAHLLWNKKTGQTVLIGAGETPVPAGRLQSANISYIDVEADNADDVLDKLLPELLKGTKTTMNDLQQACLFANPNAEEDNSIGELLLGKMMLPRSAVDKDSLGQMLSAQSQPTGAIGRVSAAGPSV